MRGGAFLALLLLCLGEGGLARAQPKLPEGKLPEAPEAKLENPEPPPELKALLEGSEGLEVQEKEADAPLTIQEIANPQVKTASSQAESAREAPARVLTFTAQDLKARGYQELTELLDDLPGMDVIHAWGDTYFKSYWRGYRNEIGEPFLLLVDGMEFNHLWLGEAQILAAIPLSSVEQVEVLYGPASARYGPNASMGVINVVTRRSANPEDGTGVQAQLGVRSPQHGLLQVGDMTKVGDVSAFYAGQGFRVRLTGRFDLGVVDTALSERFEWLKNEYFEDSRLWGGFPADAPNLAGSFRSPNEKQAVDARFILENRDDMGEVRGETELAAQMYRMLTGSGLIYAADRYQARAPWVLLEQSLSLRHRQSLSSQLLSTTLLRYRRSGIDNPTAVLSRDGTTGAVEFSYLRSTSISFSARQDFSYSAGSLQALPNDELRLDFGFEYERRNLDEGFDSSTSVWQPGTSFEDFDYPAPLPAAERLENRHDLDVMGAYLLSRYRFLEAHTLHLGMRLDYNTTFSTVKPTFRGGYVGQFLAKDLTVKVFYGESLEEPGRSHVPEGTDDPNSPNDGEQSEEEPDLSRTLEAGFDYSLQKWLFLHGTAYYVHSKGAIYHDLEGIRRTAGVDVGATAIIQLPGIRQLRAWGYYSPYLMAMQSDPRGSGTLIQVGDLAWHKLLLGATLDVNRYLSLTALGRCISQRTPVENPNFPKEPVPGYCLADANLRVQHLFVDGLSLSLRATNLLDTTYSHPGLFEANSGTTPGRWEGSRWYGSQGDYNTYLPQPGRTFSLQLGLEL